MATFLEKGSGGLPYVLLKHEASGSSAKIHVLGACVTSYVDAGGTEWLAVRPDAKMDGSKPISGGASFCFPQFGPGKIQQHGFARNLDWDIVKTEGDSVTFELLPSEYTKAMWDYPFRCVYEVKLTASSLDTTFTVENQGQEEDFSFQQALHTYFDVSNIGNVSVAGSFLGSTYLDKMADPPAKRTEVRKELTIAEEYDRVYEGVNDPVLKDSQKQKQLKIINTQGYKDTVIWSPYGNEPMGYENFLCVESVAFEPVHLAPKQSWVAIMSLLPEPLQS